MKSLFILLIFLIFITKIKNRIIKKKAKTHFDLNAYKQKKNLDF